MDYVIVGKLLQRFFEEKSIEYAVVGGFGLLAHGIERVTFDLDFVTVQSCQDELIGELEGQGYETLYRAKGYSNHLHTEADLGRVDFVYVNQLTAEQLFSSATKVEILPGFEVKVPKPEHLAAMKIRALKNDPQRQRQDLADISQLMTLPNADSGEIEGYFEALGIGHLFTEIAQRDD